MSWIEKFTPKDTEEIKPDLFIQRRQKGYRVVNPIAWNGKWRTKEQLKTIFTVGMFIRLGIIIFLAWAYIHDVGALNDFRNRVISDPIQFCSDVQEALAAGCTEFYEAQGLCISNQTISSINFTLVVNGA